MRSWALPGKDIRAGMGYDFSQGRWFGRGEMKAFISD
jgi:hypothetical protein